MFDVSGFSSELANLDIKLSSNQVEQFEHYFDTLLEWNSKTNLTSVPEDQIVSRHFVDSLMGVRAFDFSSASSLIDVGTGAGFPGLPLKIVFPHLELTLLDSNRRKIQFLKQVCKNLGLVGVTFLCSRLESLATEKTKYDVVTARALASLSDLVELVIPLLGNNGTALLWKGSRYSEELDSATEILEKLSFSASAYQIAEGAIVLVSKPASC